MDDAAACAMLLAFALYNRMPIHDPECLTPDERKALERKWRELHAPASE
jgi:hypothetical protein